jgi:hypothetical protein
MSICPKFLGYLDAIVEGWQDHPPKADAFRVLDHKLRNTTKSLKRWSQKFVESIRLQLAMTKEVIFQLEQA